MQISSIELRALQNDYARSKMATHEMSVIHVVSRPSAPTAPAVSYAVNHTNANGTLLTDTGATASGRNVISLCQEFDCLSMDCYSIESF